MTSTNRTVRDQITPEGKARVEAELRHLKEVRRPEVIEAIKRAREFGDLSENAEYHAAREEQALVEGRIQQLEARLRNVRVVINDDKQTVGVGALVSYRERKSRKLAEVRIVNSLEANPAEQKISAESPVGRALVGLRRGDVARVETPKGIRELEVLEIS